MSEWQQPKSSAANLGLGAKLLDPKLNGPATNPSFNILNYNMTELQNPKSSTITDLDLNCYGLANTFQSTLGLGCLISAFSAAEPRTP